MSEPYIIAEAAQGYEGSLGIAKLLVRAAAASKADAVKFQVVYAAELCEPGYEHFDIFTQLEMPEESWKEICDFAHNKGLDFIADVFGPKSLKISESIGADGYKLHSTNFFDDELIRGVLATNKPVYISVGGVEADELASLVEQYDLKSRQDVTILFGYQAEPTPIDQNNLARMEVLKEFTGLPVGFMDHSEANGPHAIALSVLALGLGIRIFEKHITLDHGVELEDYISGLAPAEFKEYVQVIKGVVKALGQSSIDLTESEKVYRSKAIKRVVAAKNLSAGQIIEDADIRLSRPAISGGVYRLGEVLGQTLMVDITEGTPISKEILK